MLPFLAPRSHECDPGHPKSSTIANPNCRRSYSRRSHGRGAGERKGMVFFTSGILGCEASGVDADVGGVFVSLVDESLRVDGVDANLNARNISQM